MIPFGWHVWRGESGVRYRFKITLTRRGVPQDVGGCYVFVRRRLFFFLQPLYVGQAKNFRERLYGHEKWSRAVYKLGATERHVLTIATQSDRDSIEEDLIRGLRPRMNDVLIPRGKSDERVHQAVSRFWWLENWMRLSASRRARRADEPRRATRRSVRGEEMDRARAAEGAHVR